MSEPFYYDDFDDDDAPQEWADPSIRRDYEAALGRLILAHNEADRNLTIIIKQCLKALGDPPALSTMTHGNFAARLTNLGILQTLCPSFRISGIDVAALASINGDRNVVAHGHFEQNPFDGDYILIGAKKNFTNYSTERLDKITERLGVQNRQMSAVIAFGFDPLDWKPPEIAEKI